MNMPASGTATSTKALDAEATGASASEGGSARALCATESTTPGLLKAAKRFYSLQHAQRNQIASEPLAPTKEVLRLEEPVGQAL